MTLKQNLSTMLFFIFKLILGRGCREYSEKNNKKRIRIWVNRSDMSLVCSRMLMSKGFKQLLWSPINSENGSRQEGPHLHDQVLNALRNTYLCYFCCYRGNCHIVVAGLIRRMSLNCPFCIWQHVDCHEPIFFNVWFFFSFFPPTFSVCELI